MEILTDQEAIAALETLKSYPTEAQKRLDSRDYSSSLGMCYMPGAEIPPIIRYLRGKQTIF